MTFKSKLKGAGAAVLDANLRGAVKGVAGVPSKVGSVPSKVHQVRLQRAAALLIADAQAKFLEAEVVEATEVA